MPHGGYDTPLMGTIPVAMNVYLTLLEAQQAQALVFLGGTGILADPSGSLLLPRVQALFSEHAQHPGWLIAITIGERADA